MISLRDRSISIMVVYAIVLHMVWAVILHFDHSALGATAVAALHQHIQSVFLLIVVIFGAAFLALVALFTRTPWVVALLLPQQVLLMMSASGAIEAIWISQFADGVIRSRAFIAADQIYSVLAAIGHTIAITAHAVRIVR